MSGNGNVYSTACPSQVNESEDTVFKTVPVSDICQLSGLGDSLFCVFSLSDCIDRALKAWSHLLLVRSYSTQQRRRVLMMQTLGMKSLRQYLG